MKDFCTVLSLLVVLASTGCSRNPQSRRDKFLQSGNRYFDQGKYPEAAIEYRNALQADPNSAEAHDRLATTYTRAGNWDGAVRELEQTIALQPDNARSQLNLGNILFASQEFERAGQIGFALLQHDPKNADAHSLMANVAEAQGKHDEAAREIAEAISLKPGNAAFYLTRGVFESNAGRLEAAERSYRKAIEIDPKDSTAIIALGEIYERQQRWDEAEKVLRRYIDVEPKSVSGRLELAKLYLSEERKDVAEQVLVQAQKDLPDSPEAYRLLPEFYNTIGANDKALATFDTLHKQHPKDVKIAIEYARLLLSMDQVDKANEINGQVLTENRRNAEALTVKGDILVRQGKPDAALSILRALVNDEPENALAHYALGSALSTSGDQKGAKDQWLRAAQLQPDMVQVQRALARVALAEHDEDLLKQSSERITTNDPQSPDGYIYRALAEANNKQDDKAEADLNKAIQVAPQSPIGFAKMAEWRFAHKRYVEAEKLYEQALERDPNYSDALRGLMAIYSEEKQPAKTWTRVQEQIAKAPNNANSYFLLAVLQEQKHDLAGAESSAQKAVSLNPNNSDAFELLCRVEAERGSLEKALAISYDWIKRNPKYARAYVLTGSMEESKGNWKSAQELYSKALEIQPHDADAKNNLAYSLLENGGNTDVALSLAQSAHVDAPNVPTISDTLAWAYYHKGIYKMALDLLEEALKVEPDSALYHYHMGMTYSKMGNVLQAKLHLQRALAMEPKSNQADLARKQLQELGS
jgi:tetratricopeptide (TPR) repeat protein